MVSWPSSTGPCWSTCSALSFDTFGIFNSFTRISAQLTDARVLRHEAFASSSARATRAPAVRLRLIVRTRHAKPEAARLALGSRATQGSRGPARDALRRCGPSLTHEPRQRPPQL